MLSQESEEKEGNPPIPDVPVDRRDPPVDPKPPVDPPLAEAKLNMASKIEKGVSPFDFSGEVEEKKKSGHSLANVAAGVALLGLIGMVVITVKMMGDIWSKLDTMSATISELSERVALKGDKEEIELALIKTELNKTIQSLERAQRSDNPEVSKKAMALKKETETLLRRLDSGGK